MINRPSHLNKMIKFQVAKHQGTAFTAPLRSRGRYSSLDLLSRCATKIKTELKKIELERALDLIQLDLNRLVVK